MEGQQYLAVNPDTLHDATLWSYRDLQKLAKFASIKANQKRSVLVEELLTWNRSRKDGTQTIVNQDRYDRENVENYDMNVVGNNFAVLAVQAVEKSSKCIKTKKRKSILGLSKDEVGVVSPTLLRPLKLDIDTPRKSCLKASVFPGPRVGEKISTEANTHINSNSALHIIKFDGNGEGVLRSPPPCTPKKERTANICFSPFNSVKVIAHKDELAYQEYLLEHEEEFIRRCREDEQREHEELLEEYEQESAEDEDYSVDDAYSDLQEKQFEVQVEHEDKRRPSTLFQYCKAVITGL
jgi:hypothetical protein